MKFFCFAFWSFFYAQNCFHVFGKEPLNPQESILEKTHLVWIHFQESVFIYQDNFELLIKVNVPVSIIFKISRECNLTNERQIRHIRENIFQESALRKELLKFCSYIKCLVIASYNWWKIHTVILPKHYVTMSFCKYYVTMEILQICFKESARTASRKEETIRIYSDSLGFSRAVSLNFLFNILTKQLWRTFPSKTL